MLLAERRQRVLELVKRQGFITLNDLADTVEASESTLRRDLDHWQGQGFVKRIHGGAMFVSDTSTLPALEDRSAQQIDEKRWIARAAADRIRDDESVLLDGGTTTLEIARLLVDRPVQIVTNSLPIANLFASSRVSDLVMLGGYVYPKTGVALGPLTIRMLEDVHVHQMFLSVHGMTARGFFNSNMLLVETERQMMRCAEEVVVVADHTKIGRQALAFLCEPAAVDTLIVDSGVTTEQRRILEEADLRVIWAGAEENGKR